MQSLLLVQQEQASAREGSLLCLFKLICVRVKVRYSSTEVLVLSALVLVACLPVATTHPPTFVRVSAQCGVLKYSF